MEEKPITKDIILKTIAKEYEEEYEIKFDENKFEENMLRERSERLVPISDDMWDNVLKEHRDLVDEFLDVNTHLSNHSKKQYKSALRIWFYFVYESLNNKHIAKITKRDFLRYMSFLDNRKMSSSGKSFKKSAVSSLNNYIEAVIAEDDPKFSSFRSFTKGLPPIPRNQTYRKVLVTKEEYKDMMETLEKDENYLGMAWLAVAFNVGARRAEIIQFKTDIVKNEFDFERNYVMSNELRGKGKSDMGKRISFMVNKDAYDAMQRWTEYRGYDHEYVFTVSSKDGDHSVMKADWADVFCKNVLSHIVGRRINPHIFKASAITHLLQDGVDITLVSKYVAHHEDISTTSIYDLREFEEEKAKIFSV